MSITLTTDPMTGTRSIIVTDADGNTTCYPEGHQQFDAMLSDATVDTPPTPPAWTKYPFEVLQLFTSDEIYAVQTSTSPAVVVFRGLFWAIVSPIPSNDPQLAAGLDAMVNAGLLTSGRRAQVLAGTVPE